jgi:hypothetical protein
LLWVPLIVVHDKPAGEVPDEVVVDCPDHVPCNFMKGKP